ncbi:hypothetical protein D3C80_1490860 [compost metagenome]
MVALRVFRAVDEAAQVTLFHPAETVGFFFNFDGVTECRQRGLGQREVNIMTQGLNMDQQVALGGRCQPFAERGEWLQLFGALTAGQVMPNVIAKGNHRAQMRIGELLLQLGQRLAKLLAALTKFGKFALYRGFHKNGETAVFQQNAALNLCHCRYPQ